MYREHKLENDLNECKHWQNCIKGWMLHGTPFHDFVGDSSTPCIFPKWTTSLNFDLSSFFAGPLVDFLLIFCTGFCVSLKKNNVNNFGNDRNTFLASQRMSTKIYKLSWGTCWLSEVSFDLFLCLHLLWSLESHH